MDWLYWSLGVLGFFVAAALVTAYVCYRMAFYVSDKQKKENAARTLPPGQEYLPFHDQMAAWQAEVKTFPCEKVSVTSFDGLVLKGNYYERFPGAVVELIITADDAAAMETLLALQKMGFNTTKLATHFAPIYTVGNEVDYKAYVMQTMPKAPVAFEKFATTEAQELLTKDEQKQLDSWWKEDEAVDAWKKENVHICDMGTLEWKDLGTYIYTTTEVIGAGRLSGAAVEDLDAIAGAVAAVLRNMIKGDAPMKGIHEESVKDEHKVVISYTSI